MTMMISVFFICNLKWRMLRGMLKNVVYLFITKNIAPLFFIFLIESVLLISLFVYEFAFTFVLGLTCCAMYSCWSLDCGARWFFFWLNWIHHGSHFCLFPGNLMLKQMLRKYFYVIIWHTVFGTRIYIWNWLLNLDCRQCIWYSLKNLVLRMGFHQSSLCIITVFSPFPFWYLL